jgi:hypothetical protein
LFRVAKVLTDAVIKQFGPQLSRAASSFVIPAKAGIQLLFVTLGSSAGFRLALE